MGDITVDVLNERMEAMYQKLERDMDSTRGQVFYLLANYPETRSNDGLLIMRWIETFRGVTSWSGLLRLTQENEMNFETIRRARQIIQHAGLYLPEDHVIIKRRKLESIHRTIQTRGEQHGS